MPTHAHRILAAPFIPNVLSTMRTRLAGPGRQTDDSLLAVQVCVLGPLCSLLIEVGKTWIWERRWSRLSTSTVVTTSQSAFQQGKCSPAVRLAPNAELTSVLAGQRQCGALLLDGRTEPRSITSIGGLCYPRCVLHVERHARREPADAQPCCGVHPIACCGKLGDHCIKWPAFERLRSQAQLCLD
jgi:hypothetical protein